MGFCVDLEIRLVGNATFFLQTSKFLDYRKVKTASSSSSSSKLVKLYINRMCRDKSCRQWLISNLTHIYNTRAVMARDDWENHVDSDQKKTSFKPDN